MSFGTYARRVRDEESSPARRHRALRSAVTEYAPLGYHATWAYLAATALPEPDLRRDPAALLRALDTLEASRAVRLRETTAFAARRRAEKAAGRRTVGGPPVFLPWRPHWPTETAPARLGLVAAVANRRAAFLKGPSPDPALVPADRLEDLGELHARLDACAAAYLHALGHPDEATRDEPAALVADLHRHLSLGPPRWAPVLQWLRFADLLVYCAAVSRTP
ncbi:hypothetical protein [Streptomyces venezuelae]|uniref:hypothetical protein n=1 Tax=Streptomyces venezuelae TaxID=54571 RepID=UPI003627195F